MKFKHLLEIGGNTIIALAGLWLGLMVLIIFDGHGMKFVENNLAILTTEALMVGMMLGLGVYHFATDWKQKHPLELAGDLVMILSSLGMGWMFVQLYNGGLVVPYNAPWLWGILALAILLVALAMNRLFNDLARFDRIERALLGVGLKVNGR